MPNEGVCTVFAAQLLTAGSALFDVFSSPVEARRYDYERNIQISECGRHHEGPLVSMWMRMKHSCGSRAIHVGQLTCICTSLLT